LQEWSSCRANFRGERAFCRNGPWKARWVLLVAVVAFFLADLSGCLFRDLRWPCMPSRDMRWHFSSPVGRLPPCTNNKKATLPRGFLDVVGRARFELATNGLKVDLTTCFYL